MGGSRTILKIACDSDEAIVEFEPLGYVLPLTKNDAFTVEFPAGTPEDIEITITPRGLSVWPEKGLVRVTNKAGDVLID